LKANRRLTVLPLLMAIFFMVSGGPFGLEELISDVGYHRALLALAITPFIWSLPTALMVAELSSAIPVQGGFYVWVHRALGPFWGFQEAWLSLVASIFDMAIYPTLFVAYAEWMWPSIAVGHRPILLGAGVVAVGVVWNLFGSSAIGGGAEWLGLLLLSPFVVMMIVAFSHPAAHVSHFGNGSDLLAGIMVAMWNYMGWDQASTIAGEVHDPQRTYPRAIMLAIGLDVSLYLGCVAAVMRAGVPADAWSTGSWTAAAGHIAGHWAEVSVAVAGMICGLGMFNALALSYSRLPYAMAKERMLPKAFEKLNKNGVPWVSLIALGVAWMLSLGLSFSRLVMLDIMLYGLSLILEFVALIVLRLREPDLPRPFRVPGSPWLLALWACGPTFLIALSAIRNHGEKLGSINALWIAGVLIVAGVLAYIPIARYKKA
jgi:amino acid transporter